MVNINKTNYQEYQPISNIRQNHIKVSDLASWYWCNEQCFLRCHGTIRKPTLIDRAGKETHKKVVRPPLYPWEKEFFNKLTKFRPINREMNGVRIFAGIDAIDASMLRDRIVSLVEHKTTKYYSIPDYYIPSHQFQLEIYYWIYKPIMEKMGYIFPNNHLLEYINRKRLSIVKSINILMINEEINNKIRDCIIKIKDNKGITKPKLPFKCDWCAEEFRSKCRFCK